MAILSVILLTQVTCFGLLKSLTSGSISCLPRYLDNQVFVSLANGELVVYQREAGEWPALPQPQEPLADSGALS